MPDPVTTEQPAPDSDMIENAYKRSKAIGDAYFEPFMHQLITRLGYYQVREPFPTAIHVPPDAPAAIFGGLLLGLPVFSSPEVTEPTIFPGAGRG